MLYHQKSKAKRCDRITVLEKVEDKYKWEGVKFPASFEDVETFENNNEVCVNIFEHAGEKQTNPTRLGNV